MSLQAKSILAVIFLAIGLITVISMLTFMGRSEKKISAVFLRRTHKITGGVFALLFLVISYFCLHYVKMLGDGMSTRAVFHGVLALVLFVVLALKLSIVQFYKQFLRYVPGLGMTVFSLALVVFFTSGGYFFLVRGEVPKVDEPGSEAGMVADAHRGATLFDSKCSFCHFADKSDSQLGPGLKGVLKGETLPASGKPATPENVEKQLLTPYQSMPSFSSLSEQEIKDLVAYLKTL
jgi:mono/diheme cytochrome c family protein